MNARVTHVGQDGGTLTLETNSGDYLDLYVTHETVERVLALELKEANQ